jgi:hypothetical protein
MIENMKIPAWLIAVSGLIFLAVVLEQLYISKRPIDLWGLKLNQPALSEESVASIAELPIGGIVAWHKDLFGVPDLPENWVECNGQRIEDKSSLLHGQIAPNLNNESRFLRGARNSGQIQEQDWKSFYIAGFALGPYTHGDVLIPKSGYNTTHPFAGEWNADANSHANRLRIKFDDSEVRPKNMGVVWVMRIK